MRTGLAIIALSSLLSGSVSRAVCEWSCAVEPSQTDAHHCSEAATSLSVVGAAAACGEHSEMGATTIPLFRVDVRQTLPRTLRSVMNSTSDRLAAAPLVFIPGSSPPGSQSSQILRI